MKNNFWVNKIFSILMRYDPPEGSDKAAVTFVTPECEGSHYYLKFKPCKRNGLVPEIGTLTPEEFIDMQVNLEAKRQEDDMMARMMKKPPPTDPGLLN
jgi:hypothetical protein